MHDVQFSVAAAYEELTYRVVNRLDLYHIKWGILSQDHDNFRSRVTHCELVMLVQCWHLKKKNSTIDN